MNNKFLNFTETAQELVDASSALLGNRTINIMDMEGIIIASSDKTRIGTFHAGAKHVIESGRELAIEKDKSFMYSGAREGYNMPLLCNDKIIGVIGIFGNPSEMRDIANLLSVYASKYVEMETGMSRKLQNTAIKNHLFNLLTMKGDRESKGKIEDILDSLSVYPDFPMICIRISRNNMEGAGSSYSFGLELLENELRNAGLFNSRKDIWGIEQNSLVIFKSLGISAGDELQKMITDVIDGIALDFKICISNEISNILKMSDAYRLTSWVNKNIDKDIINLRNDDDYILYMLAEEAARNKDFVKRYADRVKGYFKGNEIEPYLESMAAYYNNDRSVTKAAAELFIHKNTLQYRIKKLFEAAGLEDRPAFIKEYLMRLIIQRIRMDN